jgi:hypothetical protein
MPAPRRALTRRYLPAPGRCSGKIVLAGLLRRDRARTRPFHRRFRRFSAHGGCGRVFHAFIIGDLLH